MKRLVLTIALFAALPWALIAQEVPQGVCYQAVATNQVGNELTNRTISIRASIVANTPNGNVEWIEMHQAITDAFGLFEVTIGQGTPAGGSAPDFSMIDWGNQNYFLKIEMDPEGGSDYLLMGISQLLSVPYALYARGAAVADHATEADSAGVALTAYMALNDNDTSPDNELQTLTFDPDTGELSLSDGNAIMLPNGGADNDDDATNEIQAADEVNVENGDFEGQNVEQALGTLNTTINMALANDADIDATNEIQTADEVAIDNGPFAGQHVEQALETLEEGLAPDQIYIEGGILDGENIDDVLTDLTNAVNNDMDGDPSNELQDANQVNITGGHFDGQNVEEALQQINNALGSTTTDNDDDATNELQDADEVNFTAGPFFGQNVEQAMTQLSNSIVNDMDSDATNEIQTADEVVIDNGTFAGQHVEQALETLEEGLAPDQIYIEGGILDGENIDDVLTDLTNAVNNDMDSDATNEIQTADEVAIDNGTFAGQHVEQALETLEEGLAPDQIYIEGGILDGENIDDVLTDLTNAVNNDMDSDATNELQDANSVPVNGGTFAGQSVQMALEQVNGALSADEDQDAMNEIQEAHQVQITGGTFDGQHVEQALNALNTTVAADDDGDATNEIQTADEVAIEGGSFAGASVEQALETVNTALIADEDQSSTNEIQTADEVLINNGTYTGQTVEEALGTVATAIANDDDTDATNELQELEYDGMSIGITGGNSIDLGSVPFAAPGASIAYPQGIFGDYIVVTSSTYVVPGGKIFYMTGGPPSISLALPNGIIEHPTTPSMPVLSEGDVVQNCNCLGLLVDTSYIVEPIIIDFQDANNYIVPAGKVFILKSGMVNDNVSYLDVNGVQIEFFRPNFLRASNLLSFPEGTQLERPGTVSEMVLTGYLVELMN